MISLFKGKLKISIFVLPLFVIAVFSPDAPVFYAALVAAAVHETAHLAVMNLCGAGLVRLSLYPFGADIEADTSLLSYKSEMSVFLAGPLASLLIFVFSLFFFILYNGTLILAFSLANLLFFMVNILPVRGLDGGRALYCLLCQKLEKDKAERIFDIVTTVFFGILCILALLLLILSEYNLSLAFICCWLFLSEYVRKKLCFPQSYSV